MTEGAVFKLYDPLTLNSRGNVQQGVYIPYSSSDFMGGSSMWLRLDKGIVVVTDTLLPDPNVQLFRFELQMLMLHTTGVGAVGARKDNVKCPLTHLYLAIDYLLFRG